jgi:hypothetical protein
MNTEINPPDLETRFALRNGADALQCMREAIERAAQEIARYEEQFQNAESLDQQAKVLNWAINHVCTSIMGNARIDLAASAQAELHTLAKRADAA